MTIKINVGVNKKIGLPDYGSAGSHCVIEVEADNLEFLSGTCWTDWIRVT